MLEQDENACVNKPSEYDRARFGYKKKSPKPDTMTPTAPEKKQEGTEIKPAADLMRLLDDELGDLESAKEVLRMKQSAGRFEYKEQIEELKSFIKPLKDTLAERVRRECSLRIAVEKVSFEISRHESQLNDERDRSLAWVRAEMELEISKAKQNEAKIKALHEKEITNIKSQAEGVKAEAQQRESELKSAHAATLAKACENAELRLKEEKTQSCRKERELEEKLAQCIAEAKDREMKILADHNAKVNNLESSAQRREQELMNEFAHKLQQMELRLREKEGEMNMKLEQQALQSQQRIDKISLQLESAEASAKDREEDLRSQLKQAALKSNQLRDELDATCEKLDSQERQSSSLAKIVAEKEADIAEASQREADLKSSHASTLAKLSADRKSYEEEIALQHKEQLSNAQKRQEDMRAALQSEMVDERSKFACREKELQSQLAACAAEAKIFEQRASAEHMAKMNELTSIAQQKEQEMRTEATQKLKQAELHALEREEELNMKLQKQAFQSQQRENKLSLDLEAAESSAKSRENELSKQLMEMTNRSDQLLAELQALQHKLTAQERSFQQQLDYEKQQVQSLAADLASSSDSRKKEASSMNALQAEHTAALKSLEEQREALHELQSTHAASQEKCTDLQRDLHANEVECHRLRDAVGEEQAHLQKTQAVLQETESQLASNQVELAKLMAELAEVKDKMERLSIERREVELEYRSYKEHNSTSNQAQMEAIAELKLTVDKLSQKVDASQSELVIKCADVAQHQTSIRKLEEQLALSEISRRELHNTLQELKGNIRVFCRTRPSRPEEECALTQTDDTKLCITHGSENYNFSFDKVFGPSAVQEDLFNEVSSLVQSALDGYKVCIFAYGQTGSGKTYTMQGGTTPSSWGLIPRSLHQIFNTAEDMRKKGWHWCLKASFLEVYNEVLRDLLRDEGTTTTPQCHTIKHDANWGMMVTNLTSVQVTSMQHISDLMAKAAKLRAVGCTDQNAVSSRSHSIFALYLEGTNPGLDQHLHGALHLVDLAGSERLDKSNAVGDRLKETQNINKSLSSLADVFTAKAEGRAHVPFRNSKLTHLMEPCLSGHGKTLMTVNVGPECANSHETLCSLRFASQVSQCNTGGKAKRSVKTLNKPASASSTTATTTAKKRGGA
mmetsp:Transcript_112653/g.175917  ORF Transcript_112653/g.175917 Transcript_112653/m.175917 type:complete len:1144 (-) Transcript_112653:229-3660(-)|eukprot:CAMPEP_0169096862 /NCGR_PEP_ID=MMETSP1015-20121227/19220_1 /TAXON_ID=342587 /ORGANISM="Karlodinium micrum, Strain CCMP2283" /LENGTH=1143 /DNA_ID=CAMNT_0009157645 /DNA_START=55 /DNA_END=3486 /DNA_ORIENTATION=-